MRRSIRSEWSACTVLLAASMIPQVWADESAGSAAVGPESAVATPLDHLKQESAADRWERLKRRYPAPVVPTEASPNISGHEGASRLPIPEGQESARWEARRKAPILALPDDEEPRWVLTSRPTAEIESPTPRRAAAPFPEMPAESRSAMDSAVVNTPASDSLDDVRESHGYGYGWGPHYGESPDAVAQAAAQADPPVVPPQPTTRRPVHTMSEIRPYYDTAVDEDIRKYAESRALELNVKFGDQRYEPRLFAETAFAWQPSNFYHYPLYFEDPALERYGHTYPFVVQPFVSGARFMGQLLALPYQMTLDPPTKPMYALGWYRPGECAPQLKYQVPFNAEAAAVEAAVVTGLIFLIP